MKSVVQSNSMDDDLRTSLWNLLEFYYWSEGDSSSWGESSTDLKVLCFSLWFDFFKKPLDQRPESWPATKKELREFFFTAPWYAAYEFVEFVAANGTRLKHEVFIKECNAALEREVSAYRFVDGLLSPVISEVEISELEEALETPLTPARSHLRRALELLADRKQPDYRNSIKESISAVEAISRQLAGAPKATLDDALKKITGLHPALSKAFSALYGYTSAEGGIRHSLVQASSLSFREAKFMLVACSAFINYVAEDLEQGSNG